MDISVLIPAAGCGSRMGASENKILLPLAGRPVLCRSLDVFQQETAVKEIIIAARREDMPVINELAADYPKVRPLVEGGATRAESVRRALAAASCPFVAVHDAARPLLTSGDLKRLLAAADEEGGVILAAPVTDSIRIKGENDSIAGIADREQMISAQTPQLFPTALLRRAYEIKDAELAGDEAQLAAAMDIPVHFVLSRDANFKLTVAEDMPAAEAIIRQREGIPRQEMRYGLGWDSHRLASGLKLVLGGVVIPHDKGFIAHSDGDVLLHAVIDAMLGAASLPDIGRQFPDTDPAYKDISSIILLKRTAELVREAGWQLNNIDADIIAEQPKLAPHIDDIRSSIAAALELPVEKISVKAKTAEKLGLIGSGEAMAAMAIASVTPR